MSAVFDEGNALRYPLFQDDFGAPGDRILTDKISTARTPKTCSECLDPIIAGTRYRRVVAVFDGGLKSYQFCCGCCAAMARSFELSDSEIDAGYPMDARAAVRAANLTKKEHT